ncbi:hypothetical protein ACRAWD_17745 [Caulobacter segnis]
MRRFSFTDPDFQAAFKAFLDERRGSPASMSTPPPPRCWTR